MKLSCRPTAHDDDSVMSYPIALRVAGYSVTGKTGGIIRGASGADGTVSASTCGAGAAELGTASRSPSAEIKHADQCLWRKKITTRGTVVGGYLLMSFENLKGLMFHEF